MIGQTYEATTATDARLDRPDRPDDPDQRDGERDDDRQDRLRAQAETQLDALAALERHRAALDAEHHRLLAAAYDTLTTWATSAPLAEDHAHAHDNALDVIAAELHWSYASTSWRVEASNRLVRALPHVLAALADGRLDGIKTWTILHAVHHCDDDIAARVADDILAKAPDQTPGELRAAARRSIRRRDHNAPRRHQRAYADRFLDVRPADDDMARLVALMEAGDALAIGTRLDQLARGYGTSDPRTMDQRRLDTLIDLLLGREPAPQPPNAEAPVTGTPPDPTTNDDNGWYTHDQPSNPDTDTSRDGDIGDGDICYRAGCDRDDVSHGHNRAHDNGATDNGATDNGGRDDGANDDDPNDSDGRDDNGATGRGTGDDDGDSEIGGGSGGSDSHDESDGDSDGGNDDGGTDDGGTDDDGTDDDGNDDDGNGGGGSNDSGGDGSGARATTKRDRAPADEPDRGLDPRDADQPDPQHANTTAHVRAGAPPTAAAHPESGLEGPTGDVAAGQPAREPAHQGGDEPGPHAFGEPESDAEREPDEPHDTPLRVIPLGSFPLITLYTGPADPLAGFPELAGYGPIDTATASRIAERITTGTLPGRHLTTTGLLADLAAYEHAAFPGHDPPRRLAELIRARDGTCRFPGCRQPAHRCDIDHTTPYGQAGGTTSYANLGTLCRRHHRAKHRPGATGWTVTHNSDHTYTWTSPLGHTITTTPTGPLARALSQS